MLQNQTLILAMPLEEDLLNPLYQWGNRFEWRSFQNIHLIHVVKKSISPLEFGLMEFPDEATYKEMIPTLKKFLEDEAKKILPPEFKGQIHYHTELHAHPSEAICQKVKELKANLVVLSTRGKHGFEGLFHSSFTDHLVRFSTCDVYVVRPLLP